MLLVEPHTERTTKGAPGKSGPAVIALTCPRPPLRRFTKECSKVKSPQVPSLEQRGFCRFSGANPIASALGIRSGATPRGLIHPNIQSLTASLKQDISTLPGLGHFYFALTRVESRVAMSSCHHYFQWILVVQACENRPHPDAAICWCCGDASATSSCGSGMPGARRLCGRL